MRRVPYLVIVTLLIFAAPSPPAGAQGDPRAARLRLLCAQLSGDLTDPGGVAAFRRCLSNPPVAAMRQNLSIEYGRRPHAQPYRASGTNPYGRGVNPYPAGSLINPYPQQLLR